MHSEINNPYERRQSARHKINHQVSLMTADGALLPVESINISGTGLQLACDSWVVDEIEPRGIQTHSTNHLKLKAIIELPTLHGNKKLYAQCKVISAQRLSQKKYSLSLSFTGFENESEVVLDDFLSQFHQKIITVPALA